MADIFQKLSDPFPPEKVSWRVGQVTKGDATKASALCYIDARDVMDRLDRACGPGGWQDSYAETAKGRLLCTIRIKVGDDWIQKSDGAGDTAVEGEKGAISDAFKRCAVKWGVGRYLYDIPIQWVKINNFKQIEPSEKPKLQRALPGSRIADDPEDAPLSPPSPPSQKPTASSQPPAGSASDDEARKRGEIKSIAEDLKARIVAAKDHQQLNEVLIDPMFDFLKTASKVTYDYLVAAETKRRSIIDGITTGI